MEDFSAPSFSLGVDDSSVPSFSLGLDFDISDLPTEGEEDEEPSREPPLPNTSEAGQDFDEDLDSETLDPGLGHLDHDSRPVLKRLRRGPPLHTSSPPAVSGDNGKHGSALFFNADDEIEEFSSQEEHRNRGECTSVPTHASCSNSKASLRFGGLITSQPARNLKDPKVSTNLNASTSASFEASTNKKLLPRLTISPLRKFCLVDSDSDDPFSTKDNYKDSKVADTSIRKRQFIPSKSATMNGQNKTTSQYNKIQTESFWNDFDQKKDTNLATPVLDEFCEEYFRAMEGKRVEHHKNTSFNSSRLLDSDDFQGISQGHDQLKSIARKTEHNWNLSNPQLPANRYFYHDDARIRALVRERLRYFVPLGAENYREKQSVAENLDYMSQFRSKDVPTREENSKKKGKRPNGTNAKEPSHASGGWVHPKSNTVAKGSRKRRVFADSSQSTVAKDAGKRRVSAGSSQSTVAKDAKKRRVSAGSSQSGHWFTGENGRKVYVTKNGEELTGRSAYSNYKKENGGFRKPKNKAASKKGKR